MSRLRVLISTLLILHSSQGMATSDVESPEEVLAYIRMLMVVPAISEEIVRLGKLGCDWDDQVIWGGSPSEENIATGVFWKNLNMKFVNRSQEEMWVRFSFSYKGKELIEVVNKTDKEKMIDCDG